MFFSVFCEFHPVRKELEKYLSKLNLLPAEQGLMKQTFFGIFFSIETNFINVGSNTFLIKKILRDITKKMLLQYKVKKRPSMIREILRFKISLEV